MRLDHRFGISPTFSIERHLVFFSPLSILWPNQILVLGTLLQASPTFVRPKAYCDCEGGGSLARRSSPAHLCPCPNVKLADFPDAFAATAAESHLRANVQGVEVAHGWLCSIELDTRGGLAHIDDPVPAERK